MKYVVERKPVVYTNGKTCPVCYYKETGLGLFVELTTDVNDAKHYKTKAEASKVAKQLGSRYSAVRV